MAKNGTIQDLFNEYQSLKQEKRDLEKSIKILEQQLTSRIPENEEKSGIYHNVTMGKSVSYSKVVTDLYDLIPKTKRDQVETIKQTHTKEYPKHTFKPLS
jgi:hypothetical protein